MWDSFVKNVGVLATVATLIGGTIAFFAQRSDDLAQRRLQAEAAQRESKKVFLDKQALLFFETVPLVSRLAIAATPGEMSEKDQQRFLELFWGELGMVEDVAVARSMDLFGRSLEAFRASGPDNACAAERRSIFADSLALRAQVARGQLGRRLRHGARPRLVYGRSLRGARPSVSGRDQRRARGSQETYPLQLNVGA